MTNAPADLLGFRRAVMAETGLADPVEVGIVGDGIHQRTGGYHEGRGVLAAIGRYHPGTQYVGSSTEDYSARLARDRAGLTDDASAADIGDDWPRGGQAAWLRFNRLLVAALQAGDPALAAIRAINYSPDGVQRKRIDRQHGFTHIDDTTDSVTIHTHIEWYRDTAGRRQASLDRLVALIRAARDNTPPGDDMIDYNQPVPDGPARAGNPGRTIGQLLGDVWFQTFGVPGLIGALSAKVDAQAAADAARDSIALAAIKALASGGTSVDTTAVLTAVTAARDEVHATMAALHEELAAAHAEIARLTAAARAEADAGAAALADPE